MYGPEKDDGSFDSEEVALMNYMTTDLEDGMEHMAIRCGLCNKWGRWLSNEAIIERMVHVSQKH